MSQPSNDSSPFFRARREGAPDRGGAPQPGLALSRRAVLGGLVAASALVLAGCSAPAERAANARAATTPTPTPTVKPAVSAITPAQVSVIGQPVTISGAGLQQVKQVTFGSATVPVTSASADQVVVAAPPAADYQPAAVNVSLIGADGAPVVTEASGLKYTTTGGVGAQMQYALAHWHDYNTAVYGNLNPVGGDCANFVSQTLVARGWPMTDQWYNHDAAASWGSAWGYVPAMDEYFASNASALGLEKLGSDQASRAKVRLGDVGIFFWGDDTVADHTQVVDKIEVVNGQYKISMASHNDDYAFRDLDTTITVQHPNSTMHFWHLTR